MARLAKFLRSTFTFQLSFRLLLSIYFVLLYYLSTPPLTSFTNLSSSSWNIPGRPLTKLLGIPSFTELHLTLETTIRHIECQETEIRLHHGPF